MGKGCATVPLDTVVAYKGVQLEPNCPWSLPFGITNLGTLKKSFLMLFSIKREDLVGQALQLRKFRAKADDKDVFTYPKSGALDLATMRDGNAKHVSFDNFIFTFNCAHIELKPGNKGSLQKGIYDQHFGYEITNPDSISEEYIVKTEAYLNELPFPNYTFRQDTMFLSPGTTEFPDAIHLFCDTVDMGDKITVIATVEPITGDYISRDYIIDDLCQTCGNANSDCVVNVSDAVWIINYIFAGGDPPEPYELGDANCDLCVNVSDAVWIISYVFMGGYQPCDIDGDGLQDCHEYIEP